MWRIIWSSPDLTTYAVIFVWFMVFPLICAVALLICAIFSELTRSASRPRSVNGFNWSDLRWPCVPDQRITVTKNDLVKQYAARFGGAESRIVIRVLKAIPVTLICQTSQKESAVENERSLSD